MSNDDDHSGQIYMITGIGGRSLYPIYSQSPFVAKQNDDQYGFINLDFPTNNTLTVTAYANEKKMMTIILIGSNKANNNIIDQFIISKNI